jgi:CRP/FNR family transcriptional regulator, nitrogen oxide reductase regulator
MEERVKIPFSEISKISLFSGLSEADMRRLVQAAHRERLTAGEFFFLQGDPAERMFVLIQGRVKLSQSGPDGQQVLIRVNIPVSLFALVAMTSAESYPVTAQAAEVSQAIYWTRVELMGFIQQMPQMAMNAMRIMAEQVQELQERFRQASTERVERRLARTLIRLASQAGRKVEEGILIDLPLTRQDLAEMTGTTLYTVSRTLSSWEQQGFIISGRERVTIRFPHGLVKIAEDLPT